jgi:hypothetical protein
MRSLKAKFTKSLRAELVLTLVFTPVPTASFAQPAVPRPTAEPAPNTSGSTPEERKAYFPSVEKLCEESMTQELRHFRLPEKSPGRAQPRFLDDLGKAGPLRLEILTSAVSVALSRPVSAKIPIAKNINPNPALMPWPADASR